MCLTELLILTVFSRESLTNWRSVFNRGVDGARWEQMYKQRPVTAEGMKRWTFGLFYFSLLQVMLL